MLLPYVLDSVLSIGMYLLLIFILYKGISQFIEIRSNGKSSKVKSLVPLGAIGVILGIIGYIKGYMMTFDAIEASGNISPEIVAHSFGESGSYPILGLVCLAVTYMFKYVNN